MSYCNSETLEEKILRFRPPTHTHSITPSLITSSNEKELRKIKPFEFVDEGIDFKDRFPWSKTHKGFQVALPHTNIPLFTNLVTGDASLVKKSIDDMIQNITSNRNQVETIKIADNLELTFSLAKRVYSENTLNYEIYDRIHEISILLLNHLKSKRRTFSLK